MILIGMVESDKNFPGSVGVRVDGWVVMIRIKANSVRLD